MADENLKQFATERQWEYMLAVEEHGSQTKAAAALGVTRPVLGRAVRAILAKAEQHGYSPDHDMIFPQPNGYEVKGVSTLYDHTSGKAKIQWVKTEADKEQREAAMRAVIDSMGGGS